MKVGYYARLINSVFDTVVILKIVEIHEDTILTENDGSMYQGEYSKEDIIKSSPNIIDLIEVGDLIKYHPIQNNYVKTNTLYKVIPNGRELIALHYDITHNKKKILSIITHEQIEQMEYKI